MDNRASVHNALLSDLSRDGPGLVVCLSGAWGSGKTHLWKEVAKELEERQLKTAYTSLFGITSIGDAKAAIVNEVVLGEPRTDEDDESNALKKLGLGVARFLSKNSSQILRAIDAKVGFELLSKNLDLTRLVPEKTVICLDDLERISADFRLEDALGLANLLAEQRGCRVLLIMNEGHLDTRFGEGGASILRAYRERVVRRFLEVDADLRVVLPHILSARRIQLASAATEIVVSTLMAARCGNIRTLMRALESAEQLQRALGGAAPDPSDVRLVTALVDEHARGVLREQVFYELNPISFAINRTINRGEPDARETARNAFYSTYFGSAEYRFDPEIDRLVRKGYFDASAYRAAHAARRAPPSTRWGRLLARINERDFRYLSDAQAAEWIEQSRQILREEPDLGADAVSMLYTIADVVANSSGLALGDDFVAAAESCVVAAAIRLDRSLDDRHRYVGDSRLPEAVIDSYRREIARVAQHQLKDRLLEAVLSRSEDSFLTTVRSEAPRSAEAVLDPAILSELHATLPHDRRFYFSALSALARVVEETTSRSLAEGLREYWGVALAYASLDKSDTTRLRQLWNDVEPILEEWAKRDAAKGAAAATP